MLNFDIKRKINTLRDILVGKVPDPKAQVEQITIALIYKFMDDMDIEGMEFGGSREFFKEDYEKYAWSNIMQPENSGQQRANLYAEGIDKMSMNPHLPQLFRDIFRGAYVPYRDAETLNMFLKEINDFTYDHSEELGNAFEYLLSIMGSQGDAGQFRTPRHIIDMMVEIVDPKKTDSILDPACGTAGFLISSYKHILEKNKDNDGNSTLSADDRKRMTENFAGYDISPDMVRLSRVNMYLHKFAKPQISEYDTLSSLDKWDETYDVILANPPFMTPKGGIIPHNRYRIPAKRAEVLFVDYIAEHLNPTGKAGVIVPEGIVFQSANAYKSLRKYLVEDGLLYAVISLPAGVFNPYSGVKTSILLMDKTLAKQKDEILFVKINNDGYDLGAQRREVKGSDIPEVIKIIKDYQNGIDVSDNALVTIASKKDIAEQDYILVGERYKENVVVNSNYPMVELSEVCEVISGNGFPLDLQGESNGTIPFYKVSDMNTVGNEIYMYNSNNYVSQETVDSKKWNVVSENTVIFPKIGAAIATNKKRMLSVPSLFDNNVMGLVTNDLIDKVYLYYLLQTIDLSVWASDSNPPSIRKTVVEDFEIPLPPLHIQEEIVKEIEGYQKIIDGAKQVVENYKPTIKIDPSWEMVKLGDSEIEIIDGDRGINYPKKEDFSSDGYCLFLNTGNVRKGYFNFDSLQFISNEKDNSLRKGKLNRNDIVLTTRGTVGNIALYDNSVPYKNVRINSGMLILRVNQTYYDANFIKVLFLSDFIASQIANILSGSAQPQLPIRSLVNIQIPTPPIETQQQIVSIIEKEIAIVEQNELLIEMFEEKIKDKISKVWGE